MSETEVIEQEEQAPETQEPEWLKSDGEEPKVIPQVAHMRIKEKLTNRVADRDTKIKELEDKIKRLESTPQKPPTQQPTAVERPKRSDFDDDDDYFEAMDRYMDKSLESRFERVNAQRQQDDKVKQARQSVTQAVDKHYERVDTMLADSGLSEDVYLDSHRNVEAAIAMALGVDGKPIMDHLISTMGEGSEKTVVYLGRNQAAMNQFKALLSEDPTGLRAATYLGAETHRLNNIARPKSQAPAPATELPGGDARVVDGSDFKRKYDAAHKKGRVGDALNIKLDAKAAGVNVSGWG